VRLDGLYEEHERSVLVLVDPGERVALLEEDRCYVPAYLGAYGWIGLGLADPDWVRSTSYSTPATDVRPGHAGLLCSTPRDPDHDTAELRGRQR
jgi:hypothetical protein